MTPTLTIKVDYQVSAPVSQMFTGVAPSPPPASETDWRNGNTAALEAVCGKQGMRRTYQRDIPSQFSKTYAGADWDRGRGAWQSIKTDPNAMANGSQDQALRNYLATVPASMDLMLTYCHEPDQASRSYTAAQFVAGHRRFYQVTKAVRPQTLVGPIIMDWAFGQAEGQKSYTAAQFDPGVDYCDFFGVDTYQTYMFGGHNSTKWVPTPSKRLTDYIAYCKANGHTPAAGEVGCGWGPPNSTDASAKAAWITATAQYLEENGALAFMWFNTNINNDLSPHSLILDDPQSIAAWSAITAAHPRGKRNP